MKKPSDIIIHNDYVKVFESHDFDFENPIVNNDPFVREYVDYKCLICSSILFCTMINNRYGKITEKIYIIKNNKTDHVPKAHNNICSTLKCNELLMESILK